MSKILSWVWKEVRVQNRAVEARELKKEFEPEVSDVPERWKRAVLLGAMCYVFMLTYVSLI